MQYCNTRMGDFPTGLRGIFQVVREVPYKTGKNGFCCEMQCNCGNCHGRDFFLQWKRIGMMRMAKIFTTLIIGFTAGPAVSL